MKDVVVELKFHAYMQYRDRVGPIQPHELETHIQELITSGQYIIRKRGFIVIEDVWWAHHLYRNRLALVTCYGKTSMDMIKGLSWAFRHNDRLDLKNLVWAQGGEVTCDDK